MVYPGAFYSADGHVNAPNPAHQRLLRNLNAHEQVIEVCRKGWLAAIAVAPNGYLLSALLMCVRTHVGKYGRRPDRFLTLIIMLLFHRSSSCHSTKATAE